MYSRRTTEGVKEFSIDTLVPNPTPESMQFFIQEIVRVSMLEVKSFKGRNIRFDNSNDEDAFTNYFEFWDQHSQLRKTSIGECCCNDNNHNRFLLGNNRRKIENLVMERIANFTTRDNINLLSIGSGKFLQDLIIIFRLSLLGHKKINMVCIETRLEKKACSQFKAIIAAVNLYCETEIFLHFYENIDEIPENLRNFDVVYSIDYDNLNLAKDYSSRKLPGRIGTFKVPAYIASIAVIKGLSLLNEEKDAFGAFSQQTNVSIFCASHNDLPTATNIENFIYRPNLFAQYCINSSIEVLLYHLSFFIMEQKPLLINEEIISAEDKPFLEAMFNKFNITYSFFNYSDCINNIDKLLGSKITLVVDMMAFDTWKNEKPELEGFEGKNISVLRIDWRDNKSLVSAPSCIEIQLTQLCGERKGVIELLKRYLTSLGSKEAQIKINEWTDSNIHINGKFLSKIVLIMLDNLSTSKNIKLLKILMTPCYTYVDCLTAFFEEKVTLLDYLENLLESPTYIKIAIARDIIYCLEAKNYAGIEEFLTKTTMGVEIWKSFIDENPDVIEKTQGLSL
ncbi:MAG: hypothetical protein H0U57_11485 [Tatlockia sp.]|nr:hypothetical protein [Tatlockia sp.]